MTFGPRSSVAVAAVACLLLAILGYAVREWTALSVRQPDRAFALPNEVREAVRATGETLELVGIGTLLAALTLAGQGERGAGSHRGRWGRTTHGVLAVGGALLLAALAWRVTGFRSLGPVVFLAAAIALAVVLLRRLAAPDRRDLAILVAAAFAARLVAALALYGYGVVTASGPRARGLVFDDESAFHLAAAGLAAMFTGIGTPIRAVDLHLEGHYLSLLGALYSLLGPEPLLARFVGVTLGVVTVVLAYSAARALGGRGAALAAGFTVALLPSLVVWSATVLKEGLTGTLIVLVIWALVRWRDPATRAWPYLVLVAAALHVLTVVREHVGIAVAAVALLVVLASLAGLVRRLGLVKGALALGALVAVAAVAGSFLARYSLGDLRPTQVLYRRVIMDMVPPPLELLEDLPPGFTPKGGTVGGVVVAVQPPGWDAETTGMIIGYRGGKGGPITAHIVALDRNRVVEMPADPEPFRPLREIEETSALRMLVVGMADGLRVALLAPWSTGITNAAYAALTVENLAWLALLGLGIGSAVRTRRAAFLVPLGVAGVLLLLLAVVPGNAGNMMRQRASFTFAPLAIAAGPLLYPTLRRVWQRARGLRPRVASRLRPQPGLQN